MPSALADHDIAARADNMLAAEMGDETVILDSETGNYHQLNISGARIWSLLETPLSIAALAARLEASFVIDRETCRDEVAAFVETMRDKGLLKIRRG